MRTITKLAIANRGEVAVRIIRACQEMGITSVLLHSEADQASRAYRLADECVCIGPSPVAESYLSIENNINGAKSAGADAIHPGFGFLSENADFADACDKNRILFVGPSAKAIATFGDKIAAKNLAQASGVPTLPGYQGVDQQESTLAKKADEIGYPLMVKAAAGGGGRGLKVIHKPEQAIEAIRAAQREGLSSFGSPTVFLEKFLDQAKHIEVQIFADARGKVFHLFDRECSVQRRHQKVIEEACSPSLSSEIRQRICESAVQLAEAGDYRGAGTVEFLYQDGEFYFLEMNTRLQVEHTVTEMVLGVDLVKAQIATAQGQPMMWDQEALRVSGHAIECRIVTEDSYTQGVPSTGEIKAIQWPYGPGRRFDYGFEAGDEVTGFYDSMIAKVIVHDESRPRAIQKMRRTLEDTIIFGLKTNIDFLLALLEAEDFITGEMTTGMIQQQFPLGLEQKELDARQEYIVEQTRQLVGEKRSDAVHLPNPFLGPWGNV